MIKISHIGTCKFPEPRLNFGPRWAACTAEDDFARSFAVQYDNRYAEIHSSSSRMCRILAHEVPVNGFGIADLVTVSWNTNNTCCQYSSKALDELGFQSTVRAFEVKLSDWRRGLMQAHRYRFFADAAILVLPTAKLQTVSSLDTFKSICVGLWGYDEATQKITKIYTPRPKHPARPNHREKAITRVLATLTQGQSAS